VILYRDEDGDGFGVSSQQKSGCFAEPGWSLEKGDCLDSNEMVFPGQALFVGIPYTNASGKPSYDYNCDGSETSAPGVLPVPDCSTAACSGKEGYLPSESPGLGLNTLCGSKKLLKCTKQGPSCTSSTVDALEPAGCR
jgi:hypothetical protein